MVARPTRRGAPLAHQHAPANAHEYARHAEHKHAHTHTQASMRTQTQTQTHIQTFAQKCAHKHARIVLQSAAPLYVSRA